MRSPAVRAAVEALGGYDPARPGEVVDLEQRRLDARRPEGALSLFDHE